MNIISIDMGKLFRRRNENLHFCLCFAVILGISYSIASCSPFFTATPVAGILFFLHFDA